MIVESIKKLSIPFSRDYPTPFISARASLLNHSCKPNAIFSYDGETINLRVAGVIQRDEEITISYCDHFQPREGREEALGFPCKCSICALPPAEQKIHDKVSREFGKMMKEIEEFRERHQMSTEHAYNVAKDEAPKLLEDRKIGDVVEATHQMTKKAPSAHEDLVLA